MSTWESEMTKEEWQSILLTEQEYINKLGLECPNCHKTEGVEAWDRAEVDDGVAWQNISCSLCEAEWVDNYNLVGYSQLEVGAEGE